MGERVTDAERIAAKVPLTARLYRPQISDPIPTINAMLKQYGLKVRTKVMQRGGGVPSWIWLEKISDGKKEETRTATSQVRVEPVGKAGRSSRRRP